ncbi:hypothetical protein D3C72_1441580 [compost metagenome]
MTAVNNRKSKVPIPSHNRPLPPAFFSLSAAGAACRGLGLAWGTSATTGAAAAGSASAFCKAPILPSNSPSFAFRAVFFSSSATHACACSISAWGAQAATGAVARRTGAGRCCTGAAGVGATGGGTNTRAGRTRPSARARAASAAASGDGATGTGRGNGNGAGTGAGMAGRTGALTGTAAGGAGVSHKVPRRTTAPLPLPSNKYRCTWPAWIACRVLTRT